MVFGVYEVVWFDEVVGCLLVGVEVGEFQVFGLVVGER